MEQSPETPSKLTPALIAGGVVSLISIVPVIGSCMCCLWILLGGLLAVYLYQRELKPGQDLNMTSGVITGVLTGVFSALFVTLVTVFLTTVIGFRPGHEIFQEMLEAQGDLEPEIVFSGEGLKIK